jgi:two-component system response regulator QseB
MEDDRDLAAMLTELLIGDDYSVDIAADGQRGLHLGLTRPYEVIVVDRRLPAIDGLGVVVRLRRRAVQARILMLTALGETVDRVEGLDAGADDYMVKPFDVTELLARLRALARRPFDDAQVIGLGAGQLDVMLHVVRIPGGAPVSLSTREFELIRTLAVRPRTVHSRTQLRSRVFGGASSESIVDTYVHYLRRKLGGGVVRTVRGLGYQIGTL